MRRARHTLPTLAAAAAALTALGPAWPARPARAAEPPPPESAPAPAPAAHAPPTFDGRLQLGFFGAWTRAGEIAGGEAPANAAPAHGVLLGEARLDAGAHGLGGAPVDARVDLRARFDLLGTAPAPRSAAGTPLPTSVPRESWRCGTVAVAPTAAATDATDPRRCHELRLYAAYVHVHPRRYRLTAGRIPLADTGGLTIDGARLGLELPGAWTAGVFGGLVPDVYRRVSFADYAGGALWPGGGATLTGRGAGGWLALSAGAHAVGGGDVRVFAAGTAALRPLPWLDLFAFALLDVAGPEGFALRSGTVRAGLLPDPRVRLAVSASHYSPLAFREHLGRLLEEFGTNNLEPWLAAQDEVRVRASVAFWRLLAYAEARVQRRTTLFEAYTFREGAFGGTLGVATHDLAGLRLDLSLTRLASYQSRSLLVALRASRDLGRAVSVDLAATWLHHRDDLGDLDGPADRAAGGAPLEAPADTFLALATLVARFGPNVSVLASYEAVHDRTSVLVPGTFTDPASGDLVPYPAVPPSWTHVAYARLQLRW